MSKFPLIEELGLEVLTHSHFSNISLVSAKDLERLLSQAPVVWIVEGHTKSAHLAQPVDATHSARLVGVKEIKND